MEHTKTLTFANTHRDFVLTLNKRVNEYFRSNNISKQANLEMYLKTAFMFILYFTPYALIMSGVVSSTMSLVLVTFVMGLGLAGIGLSVMHDANHGAYSSKTWINTVLGYSLNLVGANAFNWKVQHNVLHHSFTNVHDHDEDISPRGVLRFSPDTPWRWIHRYQFVYAWIFYGLMTLVWVVSKDFARLAHYQQAGLVKKQKADAISEWLILVGTKLVYVGYIFVLPLILTPLLWWQLLLGIFVMHYVAGFILAIIFQPAHVVEGIEFPVPDSTNTLENTWAVHQLHTTSNFGNKSRWFSWYVGGLNFQVEHHLFPNICHVHYRHLASIVRSTAHEFGLPYKSFDSFWLALGGHIRLLKQLGVQPVSGSESHSESVNSQFSLHKV
jgi:linoleoyl-CoA desaturase